MVIEQTIRFIGTVRSSLKRLEDCPLQEDENAPEAEIVISPDFTAGARDIKAGSELVLLTWLHQANRDILETKPRNDPAAPLTGVFSTRSPDRPNPIGIHTVKVLSIKKNGSIIISSLEVLDGTPLIDIKPAWNNRVLAV